MAGPNFHDCVCQPEAPWAFRRTIMYDFKILKQFMSEDKFPVIPNIKNINIARNIYPLKQRQVDKIINALPDSVQKVIVFGSSHTWHCNIDSDIDVAVSVNGDAAMKTLVRTIISNQCNDECDVVFMDEIHENENIIGEIKKGVVIYERPLQ
jgi:predicted nucleotidyltransferase